MAKYNGWKNYETWNLALWINNHEDLYKTVLHYGRQRPFTAATAKALAMTMFPDGTPDYRSRGRARAYAKVDWEEIADDFNETSAHARPRALANRTRTRRR